MPAGGGGGGRGTSGSFEGSAKAWYLSATNQNEPSYWMNVYNIKTSYTVVIAINFFDKLHIDVLMNYSTEIII